MYSTIIPNNNTDLRIAFYHNDDVFTYPIIAWKVNNNSCYATPITNFEYDMEYVIYDIKTNEWYVPNNIHFGGDYKGKGIDELKEQFKNHYSDKKK